MADGSGFRLVASPGTSSPPAPNFQHNLEISEKAKRKKKIKKLKIHSWLARDNPIHVSGHVDPKVEQTFYPCASGGDSLKRPGTAAIAVVTTSRSLRRRLDALPPQKAI